MIFNETGSGSGTGGILTVTAPAGDTVTITKDGKTKTKTADSSGQAVFKSLKAGAWTVTITNGSQTATKTVNVVTDYAVTMTYFSATIATTWPEGSSCTCSDGSTTLTAPTASGSYTFTVPNAGTWTVSCTDGTDSDSETVTITTDGESKSVELSYWLYIIKDGQPNTAVAETWVANGIKISYSDGVMYIVNNNNSTATAYAESEIDLTKYNTIKFEGNTDSDTVASWRKLVIWNSKGDDGLGDQIASCSIPTGTTVFDLDVSSLSGNYMIGFYLYGINYAVYVKNLYLE